MTKKGVLEIELSAASARVVGQLIMERATRLPLVDTPLRDLLPAGRKLLSASRRNQANKRAIKLWTISRSEAQCLFHYLALYFHPQNDDAKLLSASEIEHVREVSLTVAKALLAKPGKLRLSQADAEYVIAAHEEEKLGRLPPHITPPDPSFARKISQRIKNGSSLASRSISKIPHYLQALISKKYRR